MELTQQAPATEKAAEDTADRACELVDAVGTAGWSAAAAEDALEALDTVAEALCGLGPEAARTLALVAVATAHVRRGLGLAQAPDLEAADEPEGALAAVGDLLQALPIPGPRTARAVAAVAVATTGIRTGGLDPALPESTASAAEVPDRYEAVEVPAPREGHQPKRRGLGPGAKGVLDGVANSKAPVRPVRGNRADRGLSARS
jgi:hypothetical protein